MKTFALKWVAFVFFLLVAACSNGNEAAQDQASIAVEQNEADMAARSDGAGSSPRGEASLKESDDGSEETAQITDERKIIYSAHLHLDVRDFDKAEKEIERLVQEQNGYIVHSVVNNYDQDQREGSITARVPQDSFQLFVDQVASIASDVKEKSTNSEDVTEEYVDLEARLSAKNTVKKRLEQFMEQAETTEDLLNVSEQLAKVQEEIEQLQGRIQYLDNRSEYATVTLFLTEQSLKAGDIEAADLNTWAKAKQLFVNTINVMISAVSGVVVFLIGLSPLIIPLAVVAGWLIYVRKRKIANERKEDRE